jgi:hypothetical protein
MRKLTGLFSLSMRASGYGLRQLGGSNYAGRVKVPACLQHWMQQEFIGVAK